MSSSSFHRSVELVDCPSSTNDNKSSGFAPLHRTIEVENLHSDVNEEKQSLSLTSSSSSTTTIPTKKKILTKCITVIGDGTDK